jgi:hypothetical protein
MVRALVSADGRTEWDSLGDCRRFEREDGFPDGESVVDEDCTVPDEAAEFFAQSIDAYLSALDDSLRPAEDIDPATEHRLEELGYL